MVYFKLAGVYLPARDLLIGMAYHRGSSLVVQREYSYDALGRPTARNTARQGSVVIAHHQFANR